jgi:hypothetical protein
VSGLKEFTRGLEPYVQSIPHARPFVCTGSPLDCRSFIVGRNAATRLLNPFTSYWSDQKGFDRTAFDRDYAEARSRKGDRRVIEVISNQLGDCLETNLYAVPGKKARQLTAKDRESPVIEYLFRAVRPKVVSCTVAKRSSSSTK